MHKALGIACVVLSLVAATPARADGLLYTLPKDGTWARFEVAFSQEGVTTRKVEVTLRVVGSAEQNGEKLRWIEMKHPVEESVHVVKLLVPEKQLKAGGDPLMHVARGWRKRGEESPQAISDARGFWLQVLLAGPLREVKKLENAVVTSKLGELECEGTSGKAHVEEDDGYELDLTYEVRRHKKAPFGVVACDIQCKVSRDGRRQSETNLRLKLVDFGSDGESELRGYE